MDIEEPDRVLNNGPYAFSRHPMYVGWTLMYLGATLVSNAAWPLAFLVPAAHRIDVEARAEERRLEEGLGDAYRDYKERVCRYG